MCTCKCVIVNIFAYNKYNKRMVWVENSGMIEKEWRYGKRIKRYGSDKYKDAYREEAWRDKN